MEIDFVLSSSANNCKLTKSHGKFIITNSDIPDVDRAYRAYHAI